MRKRFRTLALALGLTAGLAPIGAGSASAQPFACFGTPEFTEAFVCVVRFQVGATPTPTGGPVVHVPSVCVLVSCTEEIDQQLPGVDVWQGETLVVSHDGVCYYYYGDGTYSTGPADANGDCP